VVNFGPGEIIVPEGEILIASGPIRGRNLGVDAAVWIREPASR
jgi:hypothetical protein